MALPTFTIPVAFSVNAVDEATAARALVDILASTDVLDRWDGNRQIIEDWSTPNHEFADGSTHDGARLVWTDNEEG